MESLSEPLTLEETLRWYVDAGVDETIGTEPVDRYAEAAALQQAKAARQAAAMPTPSATSPAAPSAAAPAQARPAAKPTPEAVQSACTLAAGAADLAALKMALEGFDGCALKDTATHLVFGEGNAEARVMLMGEAPGADEDRVGQPFVGASGQLLDKMLASIGMTRDEVFISNTVFWRPPGNRTPTTAEVAVCAPFVERMVELVDPDILVALGGASASALLGKTESVGRLRGKWHEYATPKLSRPVATMVMYHPEYLRNSPGQKRPAWRDLLAIKAKLASL